MRETDRTQLTQKDPWNAKEIESNLLKRIHGMRDRQNPTCSKGYMECERDRTQSTQKDTWNERQIEPNLLKRIHRMRQTDRTQPAQKNSWNAREIDPNLLKNVHGMRDRYNPTCSKGSLE